MKNIRIIPLLHIKGPNVVKPVHTEALRIVGDPVALASRYYHERADEIIYLDVVASLYQRSLDFSLVKKVADAVFVPLTVGGGIQTIQDITNALRAGADKVAINTHAVRNPAFLKDAVEKFGSQCIVLFVEAKHTSSGVWEAYTDGGRERTGVDVIKWIAQAIDLGIGEILITSIDMDGTRKGYDLKLISAITSFSQVPVIAHGGAGSLDQLAEAVLEGGADAVAASSILHYNDFTIEEIKKYFKKSDLSVRL